MHGAAGFYENDRRCERKFAADEYDSEKDRDLRKGKLFPHPCLFARYVRQTTTVSARADAIPQFEEQMDSCDIFS